MVLGRLTDRKFSAGIGENMLTPGFNLSTEKKIESVDVNILSRNVEILEKFILENCDTSRYYVMFDGLDAELTDATKSLRSYKKQQDIIKGLIKACFDTRLVFRKMELWTCNGR